MNSFLAKSSAGLATAAGAIVAFAASPALAQSLKDKATSEMQATATGANLGSSMPLPKLIGQVIGVLLTMLGVILVCLIIYAGFLWMTAQGDPDKVKKAKAIIGNAVVGMVLVFAAYSIANFVIDKLVTATIQ